MTAIDREDLDSAKLLLKTGALFDNEIELFTESFLEASEREEFDFPDVISAKSMTDFIEDLEIGDAEPSADNLKMAFALQKNTLRETKEAALIFLKRLWTEIFGVFQYELSDLREFKDFMEFLQSALNESVEAISEYGPSGENNRRIENHLAACMRITKWSDPEIKRILSIHLSELENLERLERIHGLMCKSLTDEQNSVMHFCVKSYFSRLRVAKLATRLTTEEVANTTFDFDTVVANMTFGYFNSSKRPRNDKTDF